MSGALLEEALVALRTRREEARRRGIELVGVFGSVARNEAGDESDVDVAYRVVGLASLFDLGGLQMDLSDDLRRRVDMVDLEQVRPRLRERMERDLVRA